MTEIARHFFHAAQTTGPLSLEFGFASYRRDSENSGLQG